LQPADRRANRCCTGSARAAQILDTWETSLPQFVKVISGEYKKLLEKRRMAEVDRLEKSAGRDMPTMLPMAATA